MTIVTKTNCPTCGAECSISSGTTQHYMPQTTGVLSDGQALATARLIEAQKRIAELEQELKTAKAEQWKVIPRKSVIEFSLQMENKLKRNDHKTGWHRISNARLLRMLRSEVDELQEALINGNDIVGEAADVANYAMMIASNNRQMEQESE